MYPFSLECGGCGGGGGGGGGGAAGLRGWGENSFKTKQTIVTDGFVVRYTSQQVPIPVGRKCALLNFSE